MRLLFLYLSGLLLLFLAALVNTQQTSRGKKQHDTVLLRGDRTDNSQRVLRSEKESDKSILDVVGDFLLPNAVRRIGDGASLTFSTGEQEIDEFHNISLLGGPVISQQGFFGSVLTVGNFDFVEDQVRSKVSWAQAGCICRDTSCQIAAAVDLVGVRQLDNLQYRGYTPILFIDDDGNDIPCLSNLNHAITDMDDVEYEGCTGVGNGRMVQDCINGEIENLILRSKSTGKVIGRALSNREKVPMMAGIDPEVTVAEGMKGFQVPEEILTFETVLTILGIDIPITLSQDIGPLLTGAGKASVESMVDALGQALRFEDFPPERPASEAKLHEIIRVADAFSDGRLLNSAFIPSNSTTSQVVKDSALTRDKVSQVPEASPLQEILGGVVQLAFAAGALGAAIGAMWVKGWVELTYASVFASFGLLILLIVESAAYGFRWHAETEQNAYNEPVAIMEVAGGGRFDGILPLRSGEDGNVFIVTTYVVEVSDASAHYGWIFLCGLILSFLSLLVSASWIAQNPASVTQPTTRTQAKQP